MTEADVTLLRVSAPGIKDECVELFRYGGINAIPNDVATCFPMSEELEFRGVWLTQFEGSTFCINATDFCEAPVEGPNIWLTASQGTELPDEPASGPSPRYFELVFVGRITLVKGYYGRGASDYGILVDDLISAREIWPTGATREH